MRGYRPRRNEALRKQYKRYLRWFIALAILIPFTTLGGLRFLFDFQRIIFQNSEEAFGDLVSHQLAPKPFALLLYRLNPSIRRATYAVLAQPDASEELIQDIADDMDRSDSSLSMDAALALERIGPRSAPYLVKALSSQHASTRVYAAKSVSRMKIPDALAPLTSMLDDSDPSVEEAAMEALSGYGTDANVATARVIEIMTTSPKETARIAAARALPSVSPNKKSVQALISAFQTAGKGLEAADQNGLELAGATPGDALRAEILDSLGKLGRSDWAAYAFVASYAGHGKRYDSAALKGVAEAVPSRSAIDLLTSRMRDSDAHVRYLAITGLRNAGPKGITAVPFLKHALADDSMDGANRIGDVAKTTLENLQ